MVKWDFWLEGCLISKVVTRSQFKKESIVTPKLAAVLLTTGSCFLYRMIFTPSFFYWGKILNILVLSWAPAWEVRYVTPQNYDQAVRVIAGKPSVTLLGNLLLGVSQAGCWVELTGKLCLHSVKGPNTDLYNFSVILRVSS